MSQIIGFIGRRGHPAHKPGGLEENYVVRQSAHLSFEYSAQQKWILPFGGTCNVEECT